MTPNANITTITWLSNDGAAADNLGFNDAQNAANEIIASSWLIGESNTPETRLYSKPVNTLAPNTLVTREAAVATLNSSKKHNTT